ncbi:MAG: molybdenum cofactor biosynthesis protein MoaB [Anaerolineae bacterium]|nr:molybdenum cofactor biosynthesis protein MoaB [Anaerolineae bacterium]
MGKSIDDMPSAEKHHHHMASEIPPVIISIVTVSDSRTQETDINGQYLKKQIENNGDLLLDYRLIRDEINEITSILEDLCQSKTQAIIFNGGTGLSSRDSTYDVISKIITKAIVGFGELFRMLSYQQIGPAAMLSRAAAGIYKNKIIFLLPGSPAAVQLAWEKIIQPELRHIIWELSR